MIKIGDIQEAIEERNDIIFRSYVGKLLTAENIHAAKIDLSRHDLNILERISGLYEAGPSGFLPERNFPDRPQKVFSSDNSLVTYERSIKQRGEFISTDTSIEIKGGGINNFVNSLNRKILSFFKRIANLPARMINLFRGNC